MGVGWFLFVILFGTRGCVDFVFLGIGFVLRIKGRFVEGALHLSSDVKMGYLGFTIDD